MTNFPYGHPLAGRPLRPGMLVIDGMPQIADKYRLDSFSIERVVKSFNDFLMACVMYDAGYEEQICIEAQWAVIPATELQWLYRANGSTTVLFVSYSHTWITIQDGIERLFTAFTMFHQFCENCKWDEDGDADVEHLLNDTALHIKDYLQFLTEIREAVKAARVVGSWQS